MIFEAVGTGTDLRLGRDNDEPMMRKALNNARQLLPRGRFMKAVTMLNNGRFISDHGSGTTCYYDSRHKVIRTRLSGGGFAELIKELQPDGSHRNQFLTVSGPEGEREVIEYDLN
jgi:hypothetical protein